MSLIFCEKCQEHIDTDFHSEHEEECGMDEVPFAECARCDFKTDRPHGAKAHHAETGHELWVHGERLSELEK